jgi:predicted dienelactone hydrolase
MTKSSFQYASSLIGTVASAALYASLAATLLGPMANPAQATEAGMRFFRTAVGGNGEAAMPVALYYPTQDTARAIPMGPFTPRVAINGAPDAQVKALIVLSHGTGGQELVHTTLAEALARNGYLVAAVRHDGDNYQDQTMMQKPARYFAERPRQLSRVIDAVLADPQWKARIAADANGPLVGALGHSAGGYTVLALAGGLPELSRIAAHCNADADDPVFCGMASKIAGGTPVDPAVVLRDPRVRAVAAMAPLGVMFTASSLASIRIPVTVYGSERDTWLPPRYHAGWASRNIPNAQFQLVANAGHFAYANTPGIAIPTPDGDMGANPTGFDRAAFLAQLSSELVQFFDRTLH